MESLRPYVWLKKQSTQFNVFYCISIPSGFRVSGGLQSPNDNATSGIRTYKFNVEVNLSSGASIVDSSVGNHAQPSGISSINFQVVDVTDAGKPVEKGEANTEYQKGDDTP